MRRTVAIGVFLLAAIAGVIALATRRADHREPAHSRSGAPSSGATATAARSAKLAALAARIAPDAISPIANELDAPGGTIQRDLAILNDVFVAWQTNFPHDGNPVGENDEITAALAGDNALHFAFIDPRHRAINAQGQLCDRWGTPFRFHQVSGTVMELRSAGPDRKFGTSDDVQFAPDGNTR